MAACIAAADQAGDFETRAMSTSDADQGSASETCSDRFETAPAFRRPCSSNPTRRMRVADRGGIGLTIDFHFSRSRAAVPYKAVMQNRLGA
jgi:hypothetical protein